MNDCSDGTGQEGGKGHDTNVFKLFKMLVNNDADQTAFYDPGLGSGWRKISGNAFGYGISQNILECYQFILENYNKNDRIFLFGFSRGAATVRSLSAFLDLFGILHRPEPKLVKKAYKIRNQVKRLSKAVKFLKANQAEKADVHFIGVWDTVAALGFPFKSLDVFVNAVPAFKHKFHNYKLCKNVENAYQALSIDDQRLVFHPLVWQPSVLSHQHMRQVWFCGVHTDIGGGYREHGLSDIPLEWMVQKAFDHGLKFQKGHQMQITPDIDGVMHDSRKGFPSNLYRKKARSFGSLTWDSTVEDIKPVIHQSVLQRTLNRNNKTDPPYAPWILQHEYCVE